MLQAKAAVRALVLLALGFLAGCAHDDAQTQKSERVSTMPWNRPQSWEGTGALGSMVPSSH